MNIEFSSMIKIVPPGKKGVARVDHVTVTKDDSEFTKIRAILRPGEYVEAGDYCRLIVEGKLMMSDTLMERQSNFRVIFNAKGDVLIAGLGVGLILVPILKKPEVRTVTVVEKYRDVIDLVGPSILKLQGAKKKLSIVEGDILTWKPPRGQKWDCIYFDIWPTVCTDNLPEMETLHRKFARLKAPGGWMDSWKRGSLKVQAERFRPFGMRY